MHGISSVKVQLCDSLTSEYCPLFTSASCSSSWIADTADVVLVVEGKQLPAHRVVLSLHSNFFREMFSATSEANGGAKEDSSKQLVLNQTCFANKSYDDMLLLLKFMYAPSHRSFFEMLSPEQCIVLLCLGDEYDIRHLQQECRQVFDNKFKSRDLLKPDASDDGVVKWMLMAEKYNFPELLADCEHMIIRNFHKLKDDSRLMSHLSTSSWQRIAHGLSYSFVQQFVFPVTYAGQCSKHGIHRCTNMECKVKEVPSIPEHNVPSPDLLYKWQLAQRRQLATNNARCLFSELEYSKPDNMNA